MASRGKGLVELRHALSRQLRGKPPHRATLPPEIETAARRLCQGGQPHSNGNRSFVDSLLLLTGTETQLATLPAPARERYQRARAELAAQGIDPLSATVHARYAWVETAADHALRSRSGPSAKLSERLDAWFTHKLWGWVFFLGIMGAMFFTIFKLAEFPMGWIEDAQGALAGWVKTAMPAGDLRDLFTDGVIAGVGGVVVFLPQILILFLFLGLLEDSGYLARAGLHHGPRDEPRRAPRQVVRSPPEFVRPARFRASWRPAPSTAGKTASSPSW